MNKKIMIILVALYSISITNISLSKLDIKKYLKNKATAQKEKFKSAAQSAASMAKSKAKSQIKADQEYLKFLLNKFLKDNKLVRDFILNVLTVLSGGSSETKVDGISLDQIGLLPFLEYITSRGGIEEFKKAIIEASKKMRCITNKSGSACGDRCKKGNVIVCMKDAWDSLLVPLNRVMAFSLGVYDPKAKEGEEYLLSGIPRILAVLPQPEDSKSILARGNKLIVGLARVLIDFKNIITSTLEIASLDLSSGPVSDIPSISIKTEDEIVEAVEIPEVDDSELSDLLSAFGDDEDDELVTEDE